VVITGSTAWLRQTVPPTSQRWTEYQSVSSDDTSLCASTWEPLAVCTDSYKEGLPGSEHRAPAGWLGFGRIALGASPVTGVWLARTGREPSDSPVRMVRWLAPTALTEVLPIYGFLRPPILSRTLCIRPPPFASRRMGTHRRMGHPL